MSQKKVILRTAADLVHAGYLPASGIVRDGKIDLLDLEGRILTFPLAQVRSVCYVRDFNLNDTTMPERLTRRTFLARPRTEGLWLRLTLAGAEPASETFEGLAPIDLTLLDCLLEDHGLYLTPPDIRSNTQRIFIPRAAIADLQLVAVITNPSRPKPKAPTLQEDLFS